VGEPRPDDLGIETDRLRLSPLDPADADELAAVLDDERLHEFIGGAPLGVDELRDQYARMVAGPDGVDEVWLNWVVRRIEGGRPLGTVQATLTRDGGGWRGEVAWVIGTAAQGKGYATEAAVALVRWLREHGVDRITANVHPDHHASASVAHRAGLRLTDRVLDGERVWVLPADG
jgi:RimJ/RimL family protein N-acetyltransferase